MICTLSENEAHVHTPDCYTREKVLTCDLTEEPGHTHTDACVQTELVLICEDTSPEHEHSEACYQETQTYVCGQEEHEGHTHNDACYETVDVLVCELPEEEAHVHTTEDCYEQVFVCEEAEHTHTLICYSDQNADLETAAKWEKHLKKIGLTGDWAEDVVAIAKSQLGYSASEKNYTVVEDEDGAEVKKAYSRYGAWYGDPYGDWNAMFVDFCLHYADIDEIPTDADCQHWVTKLEANELWEMASSYVPKRGDIVFFDISQTGTAQHVGIVEEYDKSAQTVHTIEGDSNHMVARQEYGLKDSSIMGYISMTTAMRKYAPDVKLKHVGNDYTVVARVPKEAGLPGNVELSVRELTGEEYEEHRQQAMDAMGIGEIHFARFFDITFLVGGEEVEPAAPIQIEITYLNNVSLEENQVGGVVHFASTGTEVLDADTEQNGNGETSFTFTQNSFSVTGTIFGAVPLSNGGHPLGPVTGVVSEKDILLYNLDGSGDTMMPLAGVVYTIWRKSDGGIVGSWTTGNSFSLNIGELNDGEYIIQQTGVPSGYMVYPQTKEFTVIDGLAEPNLGVFYNYKAGQKDFELDKTAQVKDYINRIYQVDLTANSGLYKYNVENLNFSLVVDRSNSMLFPAKLSQVGNVTLQKGSNNNNNLNSVLTDKEELYYVITDPEGAATCYAVWWNEEKQSWYYQDGAFYAKAQKVGGDNNNLESGNEVVFGDETADSGQVKGTSGSFQNDAPANGNFYVYTNSDQYNRLHYLREAVMILANSLAALDDSASLSITPFAADVGTCYTAGTLDSAGIQGVKNYLLNLTTEGGTNPGPALYSLIDHGHIKPTQKDYVVLITDGAPTSTAYRDNALAQATAVKAVPDTTLYTVGLATEYVEWAKDHLPVMATTPAHYYASDDSSQLANFLIGEILHGLTKKEFLSTASTIRDVISESFYPVTSDGTALSNGTILHLDGSVCENPSEHQGTTDYATVKYDEAIGWYVEWENQTLPAKNLGEMWEGTIYLKAKEDFVGGNAIDTNKSATVTLLDPEGNEAANPFDLPSPNVNVRLLPMDAWSAESTVFLGDEIDPGIDIDKNGLTGVLKDFYQKMAFSKLGSYKGGIYHKNNVATAEGLTESEFSLGYALGGDLTTAQWKELAENGVTTIPYTYDDASSHGPVGEFTLKIRKVGSNSDFNKHETQDVGIAVEKYYLDVTYEAYSLSERNLTNEHIATDKSPGIEVGSEGTGTTLEDGAGTIQVENEYIVNVVDGKISITKKIDTTLVSDEDQTFAFTLYKVTVDAEGNELRVEYRTGTIMVPAGATEGTMTTVDGGTQNDTAGVLAFEHLPRGSYLVVENSAEHYQVDSIEVILGDDATNCYYEIGADGISVLFHIGQDSNDSDVIEYGPNSEGKKTTYSWANPDIGDITSENGHNFSRGVEIFTNTITTHEEKVYVEKEWASDTGDHSNDTVYVALCDSEGTPIMYEGGFVHLAKLDATNEWKASFVVHLPHGTELEDMNYTIREVYDIENQETAGYQKAIVVNDLDENGQEKVVYYGAIAGPDEAAIINGVSYLVRYTTKTDGTLVVNNRGAYELPLTGGIGTNIFKIGGLVLIVGGLLYGVWTRRKRERRTE